MFIIEKIGLFRIILLVSCLVAIVMVCLISKKSDSVIITLLIMLLFVKVMQFLKIL